MEDKMTRAVKTEAYYTFIKHLIDIEKSKQRYFYKALNLMSEKEANQLIDETYERAINFIKKR